MIKVVLLLQRVRELTPGEFSEGWLEIWRTGGSRSTGLVRHVHNRPLSHEMPIENVSAAGFDAMDELWFEDAAAADRFFASKATWPRRRLAQSPVLALAGEPRLAWRREIAAGEQPVKVVTLPARRPGMAREAFFEYWTERHWPLALNGPGAREALRRVDMCAAPSWLPAGLVPAPYDGVGTIVFKSLEAMQAQFSTPYYRDVLAPDEPRFTDPARSRGLLVNETLIFERPES